MPGKCFAVGSLEMQLTAQRDASSLMVPGMPFPARGIFLQALGSIQGCDCVVAVLDGGDPDSGTSFECGYAHAIGRPMVAVRTDLRAGGDGKGGVNLMLSESAGAVVEHELDAEVSVLARKVGRAITDVCSAVRTEGSKTSTAPTDDAPRKAKEADDSGLMTSCRELARE